MKHKSLKRLLLVVAALLLVCCAAVGIYSADYYRMDEPAVAALANSDTVIVESHSNINI